MSSHKPMRVRVAVVMEHDEIHTNTETGEKQLLTIQDQEIIITEGASSPKEYIYKSMAIGTAIVDAMQFIMRQMADEAVDSLKAAEKDGKYVPPWEA